MTNDPKTMLTRTVAARMLTLGDIGRVFGRPTWMIRRLFERGFLPEPARAGMYRVLPECDLPRVEAALRAAGYMPAALAGAAV